MRLKYTIKEVGETPSKSDHLSIYLSEDDLDHLRRGVMVSGETYISEELNVGIFKDPEKA
jgi:hypothetical protein